VYLVEAFEEQRRNGPLQICELSTDHFGADRSRLTSFVALKAEFFGKIEDDCNRFELALTSEFKKCSASFRLKVGGINDGEATPGQTLRRDAAEDIEGIGGRFLVTFIVGDQ
jgi:hypothetical protein